MCQIYSYIIFDPASRKASSNFIILKHSAPCRAVREEGLPAGRHFIGRRALVDNGSNAQAGKCRQSDCRHHPLVQRTLPRYGIICESGGLIATCFFFKKLIFCKQIWKDKKSTLPCCETREVIFFDFDCELLLREKNVGDFHIQSQSHTSCINDDATSCRLMTSYTTQPLLFAQSHNA